MFNKKRLIVFVVFILFIFFMMTFASAPSETVRVITRKVVFTDGYNSRDIATYNIEVGKGVEVPQAPTHDGMVFAGWYDYYDNKVKVESFDEILNDTHVVALYGSDLNRNGILDDDEEHFLVRFIHGITNDVLKEERVLVGLNATAPESPSADGYNFVGWDRDYTNVQSNLTVNSNFNAIRNNTNDNITYYRVTFVDGETNQTIRTYSVREGYSASTPNAPRHEGKVFDHWEGTWTNVRRNQTVTAIYANDVNNNNQNDATERRYRVEFSSTGEGKLNGTLVYTNILSGLTFEQANIVIPETEPKNEYYKFNGWEPTVNTTVTGNASYVGEFVPINDNFGPNGGKDGIADEEQTYKLTIKYIFDDNKNTKEDDVYTRDYNSRNYDIDVENVEHYTPDRTKVSGVITSDNKLEKVEIVKYTRNKYVVTFVDGEDDSKVAEETVASGENASLPEAKTHQYRLFDHWEGTWTNVTQNETVTAKYVDDRNEDGIDDNADGQKLTVKFFNEGTLVKTETVLKGMDATAPTEEMTKESDDEFTYKFVGWDKEFTNVQANLEVNAKYESNKKEYLLTVTYKYDDGSEAAITHTETVANGSTYSVDSPKANKDGYHPQTTNVNGVMPKENLTINVLYEANTDNGYKVSHYIEKIDGNFELKETENKTDGVTGATVTAVAKTYEGFTLDESVTGTVKVATIVAGTDIELKLFYKRNTNTLTVVYKYENNEHAATRETYTLKYEESYEYVTPEVAGYTADKAKLNGTMGNSDMTVEVTYTAKNTMPYKVEHYKQNLDGTYPTEASETENKTDGVTDTTVTAVAKTYEGFTLDETVEGTLKSTILTTNNEVVLKLFYKRNDVKYSVKVFYDNVLKSTTEHSGMYGETISSSTHVDVPEGMKLDSEKTTQSITLPEETELSIYYLSTNVLLDVKTDISTPRNPVEYDDEIIYTFTIKNIGDGSGDVVVKDLGLLEALHPTKEGDKPLVSVESSEVKVDGTLSTKYNGTDILTSDGLTINNIDPNQTIVVKLVVKVKANAGETIVSKVETKVGETTKTENSQELLVEKTISLVQKTETKIGANIAIVLDESGSMGYDNNNRRIKKFIYAKEATKSFIDKVFTKTSNSSGSTVSVFTFGTKSCGWFDTGCIDNDYKLNPKSLGTATDYDSASTLKNQVKYLGDYPYDSGTPYFLGLKSAYESLYGTDGNGGLAKEYPTNKNVVIFLSDGAPDDTDDAALRADYISKLSDKDTIVYTIGYDVAINSEAYNMLVTVSGSADNTYLSGVNDLMEIFDQINTDIQDKKEPIQTEEGVAEIGNEIYADSKHTIKFIINKGKENAATKEYESIPAAKASEYLVEDNDGFHVNASKFEPGDTIEFIYYKSVN